MTHLQQPELFVLYERVGSTLFPKTQHVTEQEAEEAAQAASAGDGGIYRIKKVPTDKLSSHPVRA